MFYFSKKSLEEIASCHEDSQKILNYAIKITRINFSVTEGHRLIDRQFELYKQGRKEVDGQWIVVDKKKVVTNIDGLVRKGMHNYFPSRAFDIRAYIPGKRNMSYNKEYLDVIAGTLLTTASFLYMKGEIKHLLTWGADWDEDGEIYDHKLVDRPHFQLKTPEVS